MSKKFKNPLTKLADKIDRKVLGGVEKRIIKKSANPELSKQALETLHEQPVYDEVLDKTAKMGGKVLTLAALMGAGAAAGVGAGAGAGAGAAETGATVSAGEVATGASALGAGVKAVTPKTEIPKDEPWYGDIADGGGQERSNPEEKLLKAGIVPGDGKKVADQILDEINTKENRSKLLDQMLKGDETLQKDEPWYGDLNNNQKVAKVKTEFDPMVLILMLVIAYFVFSN